MSSEGLRPLTVIMGTSAPRKLQHYPFMVEPGGYMSYIDIAIQVEWYDAGPDIHGEVIQPSFGLVKLIYSFVSRMDIPLYWLLGSLPVIKPVRWTYEDVIVQRQIKHRNLMREVKMNAALNQIYYKNTSKYTYCVKFKKLVNSRRHIMLVKITIIENTTFSYKETIHKRKTGKAKKLKRTKKYKQTIVNGVKIINKILYMNQYQFLGYMLEYRRKYFNVFGNPRLTRISDVGYAHKLIKYTFFNHLN